jgi:hypothetical protein
MRVLSIARTMYKSTALCLMRPQSYLQVLRNPVLNFTGKGRSKEDRFHHHRGDLYSTERTFSMVGLATTRLVIKEVSVISRVMVLGRRARSAPTRRYYSPRGEHRMILRHIEFLNALAREQGFTAVAVLMPAVGTGENTMISTVVHAPLLAETH